VYTSSVYVQYIHAPRRPSDQSGVSFGMLSLVLETIVPSSPRGGLIGSDRRRESCPYGRGLIGFHVVTSGRLGGQIKREIQSRWPIFFEKSGPLWRGFFEYLVVKTDLFGAKGALKFMLCGERVNHAKQPNSCNTRQVDHFSDCLFTRARQVTKIYIQRRLRKLRKNVGESCPLGIDKSLE
jgi:hypothetical protein